MPLAALVVLGALNGGVLTRLWGRLAALAPGEGESTPSPEYQRLARWALALQLALAALVLVTVLVMVAKPFS